MGDLISIVIPVYNVEKYLQVCVESVIKQTYINLEMILVDDGSTDNSGKICDQYSKIDNRITVLHKKNGGLSDARNHGIDAATGQYITFVDSDDYLCDNYIGYLYNLIKTHKADISICQNLKIDENENKVIGPSKKGKILIFDNVEAIKDLFYQKHIDTSAWGKLYKKALFEGIRYPEGMMYEDLAVTYKLLYQSKKIIWSSRELYYYVQRDSSIMKQNFSKSKLDRITISKEILDFTQTCLPEISNAAVSRFFISNIQVLREIPSVTPETALYLDMIDANIKEYRKTVLFDGRAKVINRLIALATFLPRNILQGLGRIYKKIYK